MSLVCRLLRGLAKLGVQTETDEHQQGADPLHGGDDVAEEEDGAQDGEELAGGGDDGAGERTEAHHRHEDEGLAQCTGQSEQQNVVDDAGVAFGETEKIPYLPGPQNH